MYDAHHFIVKNDSYHCPRKFTLRVDNQALSWLKTYSTDQALTSTISGRNIVHELNIAIPMD